MTNATIRLMFAGALGLLALIGLGAVVLVGQILKMPVQDIISLGAPFGSVVTLAIGYFIGHTNGLAAARNGNP